MRRHRVTHIPIPIDPEWDRDPNIRKYGMKYVWDCDCGTGSHRRYKTAQEAWDSYCRHRQGVCPA